MWYVPRRGMGQMTIEAVSRDPRLPFPEPQEELRVAAPLWGPWYWQWPFGGSPHIPPDAYYNPLSYPLPVTTGGFLPQWSGSFIQARNLDPVAYELAASGNLGQLVEQHLQDPTGGAYWDLPGSEIFGYELGPGESLAVGLQWAGQLTPYGYAALGS